jgi:type II secretory pathway predicted ATPase ExeA
MAYLSSLHYNTASLVSSSGPELYLSQANRDLIKKLSHNFHLGAGLQLVIGPYGSGKTTLVEQLAQKHRTDNKTVVLLLKNPQFRNLRQFLITVAGIFKTINAPSGFDDNIFQEAFNSFFYKLCKQEKKIVLLLFDNGQNIPDFCLQAINSFYAYNPDCRNYLQTVICGEPALQKKISAQKTLYDRVFFTATPEPFKFKDVRNLIRFQEEHALAYNSFPPASFSLPAQWVIYRMTQGHPKKTIDLCHLIALTQVIENRKKADWFMTLRSAKLLIPVRANKLQIIRITSLSCLIVFMLISGLWSEGFKIMDISRQENLRKVTEQQHTQLSEEQTVKIEKVTLNSIPQKQNQEAAPKESTVKKETPPPVLPTEKQAAGIVPTENSAEMSFQPRTKTSTAELSAPDSAGIAEQDPVSKSKQTPGGETGVISAIREEPETKPPDNTGVTESDRKTISLQEQLGNSPDFINEKFKPPQYLGDIVTASGENFGDMIRRIYGPWSFNPENIKTVLAANKNLKSPELLQVGQKIRFPTIPVNLTSQADKVWWIRIATLDNIQSAYRFLRKHRKSPPPLLIIPSKGDSGKVLFNILLEEYFLNKESAQHAIQDLPGEIKTQAETLHGLERETFYYRVK